MSTISAIMRAKIYRDMREDKNETDKNKVSTTMPDMSERDQRDTKNR